VFAGHTDSNHLTIERVADDSDKQYLTVTLIMFHIDVQWLASKLAQVRDAISSQYRVLDYS
jgi:hypothetical protein